MAEIVEAHYPHLTGFLSKCLFQDSADSFEEAIGDCKFMMGGEEGVVYVLRELTHLSLSNHSEDELGAYLWRHCDYAHGETASSALEYIKQHLLTQLQS